MKSYWKDDVGGVSNTKLITGYLMATTYISQNIKSYSAHHHSHESKCKVRTLLMATR